MKRWLPTASVCLAALALLAVGPIAQLPGYNDFADLASLTYSDSTPPVSFTNYNRAGLPVQVIDGTGMSRDTRVRDLTDEEVARLRSYIDQNVQVEGDLRRDISQNIKRKMEIGSYQGLRHRRGLPVHGQRTRTNARTRKGPKKTVAGKKKVRKH